MGMQGKKKYQEKLLLSVLVTVFKSRAPARTPARQIVLAGHARAGATVTDVVLSLFIVQF